MDAKTTLGSELTFDTKKEEFVKTKATFVSIFLAENFGLQEKVQS